MENQRSVVRFAADGKLPNRIKSVNCKNDQQSQKGAVKETNCYITAGLADLLNGGIHGEGVPTGGPDAFYKNCWEKNKKRDRPEINTTVSNVASKKDRRASFLSPLLCSFIIFPPSLPCCQLGHSSPAGFTCGITLPNVTINSSNIPFLIHHSQVSIVVNTIHSFESLALLHSF